MIYYNNIYFGNDKKICEKNNLLSIIEALRAAKEQNDYFVLTSSSEVFDRSLDKEYLESHTPNSKMMAAKFLIEAEKYVLQYNYGFVMRVQDRFSSLTPLFDKMVNCQKPPVVKNDHLWIIMDENVTMLTQAVLFNGDDRLVHICSNKSLSSAMIWYLLREDNCIIDDEVKDPVITANKGRIGSHILGKLSFYKDFMKINEKMVVNMLSSYRSEKSKNE
jgi:dTDP-4-dehydrorhamnose reductase